jgi:hypothetical protein
MGHESYKGAKGPFITAVAAAVFSLSAFSASALKSDDNTLVEGAKLCTRYLPRHERQYGIPEHLLAAIASTESGRFHRALGLNLPWPWTINVEGAGYFFDSKQEAINAVRGFQARGIASIDVGCMQVNLMHHPGAFATLDQAFDPAYNVAYAAQFLKSNFEQEGSWRKATADYHSRTFSYGEQYAHLVYGAWERIINKVADARAGRPILNAAASRQPSYAAAHVRAYHNIRLHDISVMRDTTREKGVLVIRPEYNSQPKVTQQASLDSDNEGFVSYTRKTQEVSPERSAIAPNGVVTVPRDDAVDRGAQVIKIGSDAETGGKGQFQPSAHITHIGAESSDLSSAIPVSAASVASGATLRDAGPSSQDGASAPKSPFVFNN